MPKNKSANRFYIYILECKNNNYYTGYTIDVRKRFMLHSEGKGAKYTRMFKPVRIAQCWKLLDSKAQAMKIEAFIKKKPKSFKENLIKNPRMLKRTLLKKYGCNFKIIKADSIFI